MAQRVETVLVDDLDGSKDAETVRFGLDGVDYEIDLSKRHAKQLRDALAGYTAAGRRQARTTRRRSRSSSVGRSDEAAAIRVWAAENGYELSGRGRIPTRIREVYADATS